jgi:hypothetical protein
MDDSMPPCAPETPTTDVVSDAVMVDILAAAVRGCLQYIRDDQPPCVLQARRALQVLMDRRRADANPSTPPGASTR